MIVEGKKEFLKKLCLILKQGMLSTFLVADDGFTAWKVSVLGVFLVRIFPRSD